MNNICLLGLSRSGKTCYLYASTDVLSRGVKCADSNISIMSTDEQKYMRLYRGVEDMANGWWPGGSKQTMEYPFAFMIDGQKQFDFTIYDYRGGALNDISNDALEERNELYETFNNSSCIVFLIDGYTLLDAIGADVPYDDGEEHFSRTEALHQIKYMEILVDKCRQKTGLTAPILLVITKKDIFSKEELQAGIDLLKKELPTLFSKKNDVVVGITSVSLGRDLKAGHQSEQGKKQMTGVLCLNTSQNLHIPILFALFQSVDEDSETYKSMARLFNSDAIKLYLGGEEVLICF